jgi:hypothetical protein
MDGVLDTYNKSRLGGVEVGPPRPLLGGESLEGLQKRLHSCETTCLFIHLFCKLLRFFGKFNWRQGHMDFGAFVLFFGKAFDEIRHLKTWGGGGVSFEGLQQCLRSGEFACLYMGPPFSAS